MMTLAQDKHMVNDQPPQTSGSGVYGKVDYWNWGKKKGTSSTAVGKKTIMSCKGGHTPEQQVLLPKINISDNC